MAIVFRSWTGLRSTNAERDESRSEQPVSPDKIPGLIVDLAEELRPGEFVVPPHELGWCMSSYMRNFTCGELYVVARQNSRIAGLRASSPSCNGRGIPHCIRCFLIQLMHKILWESMHTIGFTMTSVLGADLIESGIIPNMKNHIRQFGCSIKLRRTRSIKGRVVSKLAGHLCCIRFFVKTT